jgi:hypothetical protein
MAEYIDRDAALREIERREALMVGDKRVSVDAMKSFIKNRPAVDVAPMDDVQQLASELNHAAQCVAEGYVTWADIRQMLKEYGVETALE